MQQIHASCTRLWQMRRPPLHSTLGSIILVQRHKLHSLLLGLFLLLLLLRILLLYIIQHSLQLLFHLGIIEHFLGSIGISIQLLLFLLLLLIAIARYTDNRLLVIRSLDIAAGMVRVCIVFLVVIPHQFLVQHHKRAMHVDDTVLDIIELGGTDFEPAMRELAHCALHDPARRLDFADGHLQRRLVARYRGLHQDVVPLEQFAVSGFRHPDA
mmetsp:Transcript_63208/g.100495  ORF Transcript_63208/g.100495 Transcript_63208/m.100495 type:complete len:212 (-) Transcript_63208:274-909(-)